MDIYLTQRVFESKDWATFLFLLCFSIIAVNRNVFTVRFAEFMRLGISEKYTNIYKDNSNLKNGFTISLFLVQLISITFFIQICLKSFGYIDSLSFISFIKILAFIGSFIISKYFIERIIAIIFNIEKFLNKLHLQKINYRTYIFLLIFPINAVLFYNNIYSKTAIFLVFIALIITNIALYTLFIRKHQKLILNNLFYFILYLCTLEIAPYFFIYYWFTKH